MILPLLGERAGVREVVKTNRYFPEPYVLSRRLLTKPLWVTDPRSAPFGVAASRDGAIHT